VHWTAVPSKKKKKNPLEFEILSDRNYGSQSNENFKSTNILRPYCVLL